MLNLGDAESEVAFAFTLNNGNYNLLVKPRR